MMSRIWHGRTFIFPLYCTLDEVLYHVTVGVYTLTFPMFLAADGSIEWCSLLTLPAETWARQ